MSNDPADIARQMIELWQAQAQATMKDPLVMQATLDMMQKMQQNAFSFASHAAAKPTTPTTESDRKPEPGDDGAIAAKLGELEARITRLESILSSRSGSQPERKA